MAYTREVIENNAATVEVALRDLVKKGKPLSPAQMRAQGKEVVSFFFFSVDPIAYS